MPSFNVEPNAPSVIDTHPSNMNDLKLQRKLELARRKDEIAINTARNSAKNWKKRVATQGPWNPATDPKFSAYAPPSLPMPARISNTKDFEPFFNHLQNNGTDIMATAVNLTSNLGETSNTVCVEGNEPWYETHMLEFQKGILYADGRMDLCKQVLGPQSLPPLMDSLDSNRFVRHFLFGNNIIGPHAAQRIARFVEQHPDQIETWYLAGNCIDAESFSKLVAAFATTPVVSNVWLKRNPLGPESVDDIFFLLAHTFNLRTLDLDQTSLGDAGVAKLFARLADLAQVRPIVLQHIYLNANGIGVAAAGEIARFLSSPYCKLVSLYLSNNPLGSDGVTALSAGLSHNKTLQRLCLQSVGMTDSGAQILLNAVSTHPSLTTLSISHSFATDDLKSRYNWITDAVLPVLQTVAVQLQYLDLGYTQLSLDGLNSLFTTIVNDTSNFLLYFFAQSQPDPTDGHRDHATVGVAKTGIRLRRRVMEKLRENVKAIYGVDKDYDMWLADEKRFFISPQDVRYIDSVYRNRDAGMARRGLTHLKKFWDEDDETLDMVRGPVCRMRT